MNIKNARIFRGFLWMALALFALQVRGDTNRYAGPNWALADPKKALEAAAEITPASYPNCDEATVEKRMVRVYRPDGTGECQDETFVKVLTEKGKRDNRTLSFSFALPYSTVEIVEAEVLRPGGEAVPVNVKANSKETIDDSQMQMNIYNPNMRLLRLSIPKLEIGDLLHSIVRQTIQRPIIPGEFAEESLFEGRGFIRHLSYEARTPPERPLKRVVLRDEAAGHRALLRAAGRGQHARPALGGPERAAHVRRTVNAALRDGVAAAVGEHDSRLGPGFQMVLGPEQPPPRGHHA